MRHLNEELKRTIFIIKHISKVLFFTLFFIGCGDSNDEVIEPDLLETKLILKDKFNQETSIFSQEEDIEFVLTLTNNTADVITLNFGSSQQYDIHITSSTSLETWRWSSDKGFLTVITELVIQSGETVEIREIWNQQLPNGGNISVGEFSVFGSFLEQSPEAEFALIIQ